MLDEDRDAWVVGEPDPARRRDGVAFLRGTPASATIDQRNLRQSQRPCPVAQDGVAYCECFGMPGRDSEFDEGDEPPVRARPLRVGVRPCRIRQQGSDKRTGRRSLG